MRATARGESALLLIDVLDVLNAKSVQYAVIGAMAGAVHGVVRASLDADEAVCRRAGRHEGCAAGVLCE